MPPFIKNGPFKDRCAPREGRSDTMHTACLAHYSKASDKEGYKQENIFIQLLHIIYPPREHGEEPGPGIVHFIPESPLRLSVRL